MSSQQKKPKHCRYLKKPCIEDDCTHWVGFPAEKINELTGAKVVSVVFMCNDLWATKIAYDTAGVADKSGASIDSLRNHVAEGNANFGALAFDAVSRKQLRRD